MRLRLMIVLLVVLTAAVVGVVMVRESITCYLLLRSVPADAVAFLRSDGVYLMTSDGSSACRAVEERYTDAGWTHDGSQLTLRNLDGDLFYTNPGGSNPRLVASGSAGDDRAPAY